jgi:hypothetical protein
MGKETQMMNSIYRWLIVIVGIATAVLAFAVETKAQSHEGFIYGKVYTNNATYTGVLRWDNEEALWSDMFNAAKSRDQFKQMVPEKSGNEESWFNIDWSFGSIWENKMIAHQFNTQFGNMSQITIRSDNNARIKLKNGKEIEVNGEGYNDMGARIQILDKELGTINLAWEKITRIEFLPTPAKADAVFGAPLYGTVECARKEKFSGFIVWDNDERLSSDRLDGDSDDGDVSIRFSEINSLEKEDNGTRVTLRSGRQLHLTGSNDVNGENRGVLIASPELGVVKVSWRAFRKLTLSTPTTAGQTYEQFKAPVALRGTVSRLDGDDLTGQIIYDIDEMLDIEMLEGEENDIEYTIPFKNIKKITPKNYDYASIELRNGQSLLLGGGQDVSTKNGGLLIFVKGKKEPEYVRWKNINEITFH